MYKTPKEKITGVFKKARDKVADVTMEAMTLRKAIKADDEKKKALPPKPKPKKK